MYLLNQNFNSVYNEIIWETSVGWHPLSEGGMPGMRGWIVQLFE